MTESDVEFIPEWGKKRMRGMLESRPDWCISRQRSWGLPIPVFYGDKDGEGDGGDGGVLLTEASVEAVARNIRKYGSDVWFKEGAEVLLDGYDVASDDDAPKWVKELSGFEGLIKSSDIFDVWFESGSSWNAVMRERGIGYPVDLYLEGTDQHRGWFQLSLLPALGVTGVSPFRSVLTHGFMVDAQGMKMSKSGGNALTIEELFKEHGADVCRWWVSSLNYTNDIKIDMEFFRLAGEEYRKVRNTIRFLLSNLNDFDVAKDRRELGEGDEITIDGWAMGELAKLIEVVKDGYETYQFRKVREAIYDFCNETMSAVYLTTVKDRLYCDKVDSDRRRRTQTVMYDIVEALVRLVGPILVHTADEAWLALMGSDVKSDECVHVGLLPDDLEYEADEDWAAVIGLRDRVLKVLEEARAQRGLDNPLDGGVEVAMESEAYEKMKKFEMELADMCGVSRFELDENGNETIGVIDLRNEARCERSWKRDGTVKERSDGGMLSDRDADAIGM